MKRCRTVVNKLELITQITDYMMKYVDIENPAVSRVVRKDIYDYLRKTLEDRKLVPIDYRHFKREDGSYGKILSYIGWQDEKEDYEI